MLSFYFCHCYGCGCGSGCFSKGPDKKPDPEVDIQKMLLESLQLLGQKRAIRESMRQQKVYPICRNLDYLQDDEDISNIIYEIVQLTMGDEDPDTPVDNVKKWHPEESNITLGIDNGEHDVKRETGSGSSEGTVKVQEENVEEVEECDLDEVD